MFGVMISSEGPAIVGLTFDPESLSAVQRAGQACVVCEKRWPLPPTPIGVLPDGSPVYACSDCSAAIDAI